MNFAATLNEFDIASSQQLGQAVPLTAFIVDRNPVLSQCISSFLRNAQHLECKALEFDRSRLPVDQMEDGGVVVFDPTQIDEDVGTYLADLTRSDRHFTVAYSFDTSHERVLAAFEAGVNCYASKEQNLSILYLAIAAAGHGGRFLCPSIDLDITAAGAADPHKPDPKDLLSERELAVVAGLASGLSQKQVAYNLQLSDKTVSTYKSRATRKLGLTDRASLVEFAIENNMMGPAQRN